MIFPSLEQARELAREANTIPLCRIILADTETPVSVWMKLFRDRPYSFLLESVTGGELVARYSFLGGDPFMVFRANGKSWSTQGDRSESGEGDPIGVLRKILAEYRPARVPGLPRFSAGAVGFFSYDSVRLTERIPDKNPREDILDEILFGFYRDLIVFDNREHRILLISNVFVNKGQSIEKEYDATVKRLHATEELNHATLISNRIIQLGGTPVLTPEAWSRISPCKYDAPADPYVAVLLDQNIAGERCAITTYKGLMDATKDKDMVTYNMALTILEQEVEHEEDLQSLREDLDLMVQRGSK